MSNRDQLASIGRQALQLADRAFDGMQNDPTASDRAILASIRAHLDEISTRLDEMTPAEPEAAPTGEVIVIPCRNKDAKAALIEYFEALMGEHGIDEDEGIAGVFETNAELWRKTGDVYPQGSE